MPVQAFNTEQTPGYINAYASFSDGSRQEVTSLPGLTVTSAATSYFTVSNSSGGISVRRPAHIVPFGTHACPCHDGLLLIQSRKVSLACFLCTPTSLHADFMQQAQTQQLQLLKPAAC